MKKEMDWSRIAMMMLLAACVSFAACGDGSDPVKPGDKKVSIDTTKLLGTWELQSFSQKWVNTDENIVELDTTITSGTIKFYIDKDERYGETHIFYKENFYDGTTEYTGQLEVSTDGKITLRAEDGFLRNGRTFDYEFTLSFPAADKMQWTYDWTGTHIQNTYKHQDKRTASASFNKKK